MGKNDDGRLYFANIPDVAVNVRSGADQYARRGGKNTLIARLASRN